MRSLPAGCGALVCRGPVRQIRPLPMPEIPYSPDPKRFEVSRATLWFDRFMGWLIRFGGIGVIWRCSGSSISSARRCAACSAPRRWNRPGGWRRHAPAVLGVDEWGEMPFVYDGGGQGGVRRHGDPARRSEEAVPVWRTEGHRHSYDAVHQRVALGLDDGRVGSFLVNYERKFEADGKSPGGAIDDAEPWFTLAHGERAGDGGELRRFRAGRVIVAKRGRARRPRSRCCASA
jgi:phosphate transport system permease protein